MKRILFALGILALVLPALRQADAGPDVSINFFYDNLGDDGNWVEVGDYGYCWQPNVAATNADWRPYSDGYWAYTDVGWTWVSNEDFGWATYHYGRWARLQDMGWVWVPGREWGPAWVSWRTGGDYVGWAPLPPQRVADGEVVYEGRPITNRVDIDFDIGPAYYNFVNVRYVGDQDLRSRLLQPQENVTYINRTVNVTNITYTNSRVYNHGPDFDRLNQYSTRKIQRLNLERENNVDLSAAVHSRGMTKVEGGKLMIAAPMTFQKPQKGAAPKVIKQRIEKPNVERGWSGISDPKAKAQLEQKIKAEDPKKVPPPQEQAAAEGAMPSPAASVAGSTPAPAATAAPQATATASPMHGGRGKGKEQQPGRVPEVTASATPHASVTPMASPNEQKRGGREQKHGRPAGHVTEPSPVEDTSTPSPQATPFREGKPKGKTSLPPSPALTPGTAASEETTKERGAIEKTDRHVNAPNAERAPKTEAPPHNTPPIAREPIAPRNARPEKTNETPEARGHGGKEKKEKETSPAPQQ